ncbi:hypothetical protein SB5439_04975 [Klebsiella variicola]|uniref:immunoglobulin domain-containing protein n=1 Tax=Klebsiella variicola TaxID=244366 RepID=UPI00109D37FB|nr:immunoglobulin domain-containing protein [Klebsiella variicola]VGQ11625.1 hypothetical protein SB5439_04975 [Klebsiella variicola]
MLANIEGFSMDITDLTRGFLGLLGSRRSSATAPPVTTPPVTTPPVTTPPVTTPPVVTPQPLAIATQPKSQTVAAGGTVTFSVVASGGTPPYSYQWKYEQVTNSGNTGDMPDGTGDSGTASGSKLATLTIVNVSATATTFKRWCVVRDAKGDSVSSDKASITLTP